MARVPISFTGRVKGGPARGGVLRQIRFYTDDTLGVAKTLFRRETGGGLQPVVINPNAGIPRALAANRGAGDTFVTVAIGQTGSFNVGDLIPIWNAVQGTVYRVITAINAGTGQIDVDSALGIAFTVANGTQVNATDMEGHVWGWADDATATWMQVTELGSNRLLAPVKVANAAPALTIAVQEEGGAVNNRATLNFIGDPITAVDDPGNARVNVTVIGRFVSGAEATPGVHATADTDTGLWWEGSNVVSIVAGAKRVAQLTGVASAVNYHAFTNSATTSAIQYAAAGSDASVNMTIGSKGTASEWKVEVGALAAFRLQGVASAVNFVNVTNAATGGPPIITGTGSDAAVNLVVDTKGAASAISLRTGGLNVAQFIGVASAVNYLTVTNAATGIGVIVAEAGSDAVGNVYLSGKGATSVVGLVAGATALFAQGVASAVNYIAITNAATATPVLISAAGTDTNIGVFIVPKGTSDVQLRTNASGHVYLGGAGSDYIDFTTPTGTNRWSAGGSSSNVDIDLVPKGTGNLKYKGATLAPGNGVTITTASATLGSNVTVTTDGTWYDGATVSLPAGTWLVVGAVTFGNNGQSHAEARLSDGSTHWASGQTARPVSGGVTGQGDTVPLGAIITLGSTTTVKVQGTGTESPILAATSLNGVGNNATWIAAAKFA